MGLQIRVEIVGTNNMANTSPILEIEVVIFFSMLLDFVMIQTWPSYLQTIPNRKFGEAMGALFDRG